MITSAILVILFASTIGVFLMVKSFSLSSIAEQNLQRDLDIVMNRIVRGAKEGGNLYGLRSAVSADIPVITEIDFKGADNQARKYYISNGALIYESPTASPARQTIYTPPANSTMNLRFWEAAGYIDHETFGIYISVTQNAVGKTVSGSLSTYVNLRNIVKS